MINHNHYQQIFLPKNNIEKCGQNKLSNNRTKTLKIVKNYLNHIKTWRN